MSTNALVKVEDKAAGDVELVQLVSFGGAEVMA